MGLCLGLTFTEIFGCVLIFLEFLFDRRDRLTCYNTDKGEMSRVVEMAAPLALSAYVRSILLNVEHILIPKKLRQGGESRAEAYSHYGTLHGMALPLVTYPMSPLSSFAGLLVPEFAEASAAGHKDRMGSIAARALNLTLTYAAACAVYLYSFSAELGYLIYKSYEAGYYIAVLSPVIPIMFLDHVTDSMLKGIGEQVFSMWVNISDSLLSVILVCLLIPKMGIMGYAVVIVIMEGYNFILSLLRLLSRVKFRISIVRSIVIPATAALISAVLSKVAFDAGGALTTPYQLIIKIIFALSAFFVFYKISDVIYSLFVGKFRMKTVKKAE
jgi:stage V sporulation protein B